MSRVSAVEGRSGGSEPLQDAVERALSDELLGELVPARTHLAADDAVVAEAVLAHPVEPRRVDVDRHRGLSVLVAHPMDVAGAALPRVSGAEVERDVLASVDQEVLPDAARRDGDPDARDIVVVVAGRLDQPRAT